MTDKLHCPFCGAELEKEMAGDIETGRLVCCTKNCPVVDQNLFPDVWKLLTDGKKAQDALKVAIDIAHKLYDEIRYNNCIENTPISDEVMRFANEQIQKITSITTRNENEIS